MKTKNLLSLFALILLTANTLVSCSPPSDGPGTTKLADSSPKLKESTSTVSPKTSADNAASQPSTAEIVTTVKQLVLQNSHEIQIDSVKEILIFVIRKANGGSRLSPLQ